MREEFDTPTTQDIRQWRLFLASQLRRSKDARRCFSGSENDWKRMIRSLENPGVYENPCGDLMLPALAHSLCVDVIQHEEDVGAHLPSLLHSGFPQKVRVNVKNVFLLFKGLCHQGSIRTIIWLKMYDRILGKIWHLYLFTQAMLLWCYFWNYRFCAKPDIALLLCVCH